MIDSGPVLAPIGSRPVPRPETVRHDQTADLLEALRRRRGEREAPSFDEDLGQSASVHVVEFDLEIDESPIEPEPAPRQRTGGFGAKKGRPSMPSWDEIVFGARSDDDDLA